MEDDNIDHGMRRRSFLGAGAGLAATLEGVERTTRALPDSLYPTITGAGEDPIHVANVNQYPRVEFSLDDALEIDDSDLWMLYVEPNCDPATEDCDSEWVPVEHVGDSTYQGEVPELVRNVGATIQYQILAVGRTDSLYEGELVILPYMGSTDDSVLLDYGEGVHEDADIERVSAIIGEGGGFVLDKVTSRTLDSIGVARAAAIGKLVGLGWSFIQHVDVAGVPHSSIELHAIEEAEDGAELVESTELSSRDRLFIAYAYNFGGAMGSGEVEVFIRSIEDDSVIYRRTKVGKAEGPHRPDDLDDDLDTDDIGPLNFWIPQSPIDIAAHDPWFPEEEGESKEYEVTAGIPSATRKKEYEALPGIPIPTRNDEEDYLVTESVTVIVVNEDGAEANERDGKLAVTITDIDYTDTTGGRAIWLIVEARIENVGEEVAAQAIQLFADGDADRAPDNENVDTQSVTIDPGDEETIFLDFQVDNWDMERIPVDTVHVASNDDLDEADVSEHEDSLRPELVTFEVTSPEDDDDAEEVTIRVTADAEDTQNDRQSIAVGFPDLEEVDEEVLDEIVSIDDHNLETDEDDMVAPPGTELSANYGDNEVVSEYPLVEGWVTDQGPEDDELYLELTVTPEETDEDEFRVQAKTVAATEDWQLVGGDPDEETSDAVDQQNEYVYEETVTVDARSIAEGPTVYVGSADSNLYAVDAATGEQVWTFENPGAGILSSPTGYDGTIYVGSNDNNLYAIDAETGEQVWAFEKPDASIHSSPTVYDGTIYIASTRDENNLYAVNARTGEEEWVFEEPRSGMFGGISTSPTVYDGNVYILDEAWDLYSIDINTGEKEWMHDIEKVGRSGLPYASPTAYRGSLYVQSKYSNLYALDAATGDEEWIFENGGESTSSPIVVQETVYIGGENLHALDAATGEQKWVFEEPSRAWSSPTVYDGIVYIGSREANLYAVDAATGESVWVFEMSRGIKSSPTGYDDIVYVGSGWRASAGDESNLYAVDAVTGEQKWVFEEPSESVSSSPTVVADPAEGSSVCSRIRQKALGHHDRTD